MPKDSAGILLFKILNNALEVFLVHPGGPFFAAKDAGVWSVPKGLLEPGESHLQAARREFEEETGQPIDGDFVQLTPIKQKNGKVVHAWAVEGDIDAANIVSNAFSLEWPPRSGQVREFPEIDRGDWFLLPAAKAKINETQAALIDELAGLLRLQGRP